MKLTWVLHHLSYLRESIVATTAFGWCTIYLSHAHVNLSINRANCSSDDDSWLTEAENSQRPTGGHPRHQQVSAFVSYDLTSVQHPKVVFGASGHPHRLVNRKRAECFILALITHLIGVVRRPCTSSLYDRIEGSKSTKSGTMFDALRPRILAQPITADPPASPLL